METTQEQAAPKSCRDVMGDDFRSPLGFRWLWYERLGCYVCATPDCNAREVDAHTEACCKAAAAWR